MAILTPFRKKGGLKQLVQIVEMSDATKQKGLLHLVATEDPGWAHLVKIKILTVARIMKWPKEAVAQALSTLPPELLIQLYHTLNEEQKSVFESAVSARTWREIRELMMQEPEQPVTAQAAVIKFIQSVRELDTLGVLPLARIDPDLVLSEKLAM